MNYYEILKRGFTFLCLTFVTIFSFGRFFPTNDSIVWQTLTNKDYSIHYTVTDAKNVTYINNTIGSGITYISKFFGKAFPGKFDVYVFPSRSTLDQQWQKDWNDSNFHSECWMIASGVAHRLDLLSLNAWSKEACDHNATDTTEIRQVIWHELTHVYHGQHNPDHTFTYIEKLDWLVEGLATYVSRQLDDKRIQRIKQLVQENKAPATLDNFWKGQEKYGLSGSMVAFIDKKYGRKNLFELLRQTNKTAALTFLNISETQLLSDWKIFFQ